MKKIMKFLLIPMLVLLWGFSNGVLAQGETCATAVAVTPGVYTADGPATGAGAANVCYTSATNADWYSFTPTADGIVTIESTTSGADTRLSFYDGACGTLNCVASDDDSGPGYLSIIAGVSVTSGVTYYIEWDDRWDNSTFDWELTFQIPGENCDAAIAVTPGNYNSAVVQGSSGAANVCFTGATDAVWYSYTPSATGTVEIESTTSGADTRLSFYDGSCGALNCVASDDDSGSGYLSLITGVSVTSGTTYYIEWDDRWDTDPFDWTLTLSTCPDPTALTTSSITTSSATISWTAGGSETAWEYDYGLAGYGPPAGSGTAVGSATANLSGLTAATDYDWYVRADCGGGSYSEWVMASFATACATQATLDESFEGGTFPTCWSQDSSDDFDWTVHSGSTTSGSTGPSSASDGTYYLYTETSSPVGNSDVAIVYTPEVDLSGFTAPRLNFMYHMYGAGMDPDGSIDVSISDNNGATYTSIWSQTGNQGDQWNQTLFDLASYASSTVIFRITGTVSSSGTSYQNDFAIDAFKVEEIPACPDPTAQNVSGITLTSADLAWTENGSATAWDIELGPVGFTPTGTPTQSGVTNPYTYSGLTASTQYDWYVRATCGSNWVGPNTFTTACAPLAIPYEQNFDSGIEWPACWSESGDDVFSIAGAFNGAGSSVYSSYTNQGHGYLYSPEFDATSSSDLHVRFFHYWRADWSNETQDGLFYGSPDGGATVYLLDEWHHNNPSLIFGWNEYDISSWADGASNLTFWFDLDMGDDYYWIIDYFGVQEGAFSTHGQWTGATDTDWHTASNWADGIVPFSFSDVTIPTGLTNYPTASAAGYYAYMDVASDATGDASLLTGGNLTMTGGGSATVHRYITTDQWHLIGASTSGNESGMFGGDYLESHDEATNVYSYISSTHVALPMGTGFAYYDYSGAGNNDNNYAYTGDLSTGESMTLARSAAGSNNGWNLVANPFPSAIDWDAAAGWTKTNIGGTVYYYNGSNWATWNGTTGVNGGNQYIPMGQGFFVTVNDDGSTTGTLGIDYAAQVHNGQAFWKGDNFPTNAVRIAVSSANGTDEMVVNFNENATTEFDSQLDAYKLMNLNENAPNIYAMTDVMYSINTTPEVKSMPVNVVAIEGTYTISKVEGDLQVTLEDTYTGEFTDLNAGDYTFEYAENQDARFVLHFGALSVEEDLANIINVFDSRGSIVVTVPSNVDAQISVVNVLGQEVANVKAVDGQTVINVENDATYLVQIISNGTIVTEKVFVK